MVLQPMSLSRPPSDNRVWSHLVYYGFRLFFLGLGWPLARLGLDRPSRHFFTPNFDS